MNVEHEIEIDVESLMKELQAKADQMRAEHEAAEFGKISLKGVRPAEAFRMENLSKELRLFRRNCYVEYDIPISGKGAFVKKLIRKLYRFHLKPLFDKQNDVNLEVRVLFGLMRDFVAQSQAREHEQEERLEQLEAQLKQLKVQMEKNS